jgi:membrane protease YdiL (CAAX protease family)
MFCFVFILAYPSFLYLVHAGLYLIGSWVLSEKTIDAVLDRCDFVMPLVSLVGVLILIMSICTPTVRILTSAFEWPMWFDLPIPLSLGVTIFVSTGIGMTFYYAEIIVAQVWLKLRVKNKPTAKRWMFGETKLIVRQGQKLPISLLLVYILGEAFLEEIIWRGYLISYATSVLNIPIQYAVIISSVAFGTIHLSYGLANIVSKAIFGVILSLMYLVSNSLLPAILCHQVFNIMVFKIRIEWKS